jgi:hypothetical protein
MFGTDVLNKKSMVGQVRERFTKGQSQEIFLKSINSEISTFCKSVCSVQASLFFTFIPNSAINCVKI